MHERARGKRKRPQTSSTQPLSLQKKDEDGGLILIISNMQLDIWLDAMPADRAYWSDWMGSVQKVLLPDTSENLLLVNDLISHKENLLGIGAFGDE